MLKKAEIPACGFKTHKLLQVAALFLKCTVDGSPWPVSTLFQVISNARPEKAWNCCTDCA